MTLANYTVSSNRACQKLCTDMFGLMFSQCNLPEYVASRKNESRAEGCGPSGMSHSITQNHFHETERVCMSDLSSHQLLHKITVMWERLTETTYSTQLNQNMYSIHADSTQTVSLLHSQKLMLCVPLRASYPGVFTETRLQNITRVLATALFCSKTSCSPVCNP